MPGTGTPRFVCIKEPTGTWAVWDEEYDRPADLFEPLVGLGETHAQAACRILNSMKSVWRGRVWPKAGVQAEIVKLRK